LINPYSIKQEDLPLVVLSDHTSGWIQFLIKMKSNANYNHIMWMHKPGMLASQGNMFSEIPLSRYMTGNSRLKFWKPKWTTSSRLLILNMIDIDLKKHWWHRKYDYLGILGQAIGIKKINSPGSMYCSERVAYYLRKVFDGIPAHPSPHDLNQLFKTKEEDFQVYERWQAD